MIDRKLSFNLLLILVSVLCTGIVLELALRVISHRDIDGNVYIGKLRLRPFSLPVNKLKLEYQQFLEKARPYGQYDPDLGWSVRPSSQSENGLYVSNAAGIRTATGDQPTSPTPVPGILRIAIFGDSFTHGDDVPFVSSWGAILERHLNLNGLKSEVLNFGGQGYAMDQAFLRWKKNGKSMKPHVVIFGFQNSNIKRNLNIIRMFYSPNTGIPFSKPRFTLSPDDSMALVNSPSVTPEGILKVFSDIENWPLTPYEFYYQKADYQQSPWYTSRLAAFIISGVANKFSSRRKYYDFFAESSESRQLTERIIEEFRREVVDEDARFIIVHLPTKGPLDDLLKGNALDYQNLLDELGSHYEMIDPAPGLISESNKESYDALFAKTSSHYSPLANQIIGEWIAAALLENHSEFRPTSP